MFRLPECKKHRRYLSNLSLGLLLKTRLDLK